MITSCYFLFLENLEPLDDQQQRHATKRVNKVQLSEDTINQATKSYVAGENECNPFSLNRSENQSLSIIYHSACCHCHSKM